jgi:hypothetical protein
MPTSKPWRLAEATLKQVRRGGVDRRLGFTPVRFLFHLGEKDRVLGPLVGEHEVGAEVVEALLAKTALWRRLPVAHLQPYLGVGCAGFLSLEGNPFAARCIIGLLGLCQGHAQADVWVLLLLADLSRHATRKCRFARPTLGGFEVPLWLDAAFRVGVRVPIASPHVVLCALRIPVLEVVDQVRARALSRVRGLGAHGLARVGRRCALV